MLTNSKTMHIFVPETGFEYFEHLELQKQIREAFKESAEVMSIKDASEASTDTDSFPRKTIPTNKDSNKDSNKQKKQDKKHTDKMKELLKSL